MYVVSSHYQPGITWLIVTPSIHGVTPPVVVPHRGLPGKVGFMALARPEKAKDDEEKIPPMGNIYQLEVISLIS
jgi:hypothetical protein